MPSKTSFCNGTEFRKCLSRWWPLWVIYGVILFILLPGVLLNARTTTPYVSTEPLERHSLRDADAAAADGVLRGPARSRRHVRLSVHAARRGTGRLPADPARVHVPHAPAGGSFDAAFGRGRGLRSRRADRSDTLHARHRAAAHLAGHTRARDGRILRYRRAVRHVHRPRGHAAVPVPARELHRRGLPAARRGRALHVRVRHVGHGVSAGRLALPAGAVHAAHKCQQRLPAASDQRHGCGGRRQRLLRLDLSARLGGCCSCARVSSTGAAAWRARATPSPSRCSSRC